VCCAFAALMGHSSWLGVAQRQSALALLSATR
jgi:hypothetical protein